MLLAAARQSVNNVDNSNISRFTVACYFGLFITLAFAVEIINRRYLYAGNDGLFWQVTQGYHAQFGRWFEVQNSDPLQGMFDIFPQAYRGTFLLDTLSSLPLASGIIAAAIHAAYAGWAGFSTYLMARAAGVSAAAALLAGILLPILMFPGLLPGSGAVTHILALNPNYSYITSSVVLAIALFWMVKGQSTTRFIVGALAAIVVVADSCNGFALHMTLLLPAVVVFGLGGLFASENARELRAKLMWAIVVAGGLLALGFPAYLYALGSNTAFGFFFQELNDFSSHQIPTNANLVDDFSYVLRWRRDQPAALPGGIASTLGLFSATFYALFENSRRFRIFAVTFLVLVFGIGLITFVCHYSYYFTGHDYKGPNPFHMVYSLWPFHVIFASRALHDLVQGLVRRASGGGPARQDWTVPAGHGLIAAALALPICGMALSRNVGSHNVLAQNLEIKSNGITDYLSAHIGVAFGTPHRGTVATFVGTHGRQSMSLLDVYGYVQLELLLFNQNDMSYYGLWAYGIPTLVNSSVALNAQSYLMTTELLARPSDRQARSFAVITVPEERFLKLWGVRYLITDFALPFGDERLQMPVVTMADWYRQSYPDRYRGKNYDSPLRLYEVSDVNLGTYSPTRVVVANDAAAILALMRDPEFEGKRSVIVSEEMRGNFVPTVGASMTVEQGGLSLRAASQGESLLVLPAQYSHCWELRGASNASLFRANLQQLGVRFSGELKAELRQVFGPFWHSHCRVKDGDDMVRLRIGDARSE
jgi:hypothetical protein